MHYLQIVCLPYSILRSVRPSLQCDLDFVYYFSREYIFKEFVIWFEHGYDEHQQLTNSVRPFQIFCVFFFCFVFSSRNILGFFGNLLVNNDQVGITYIARLYRNSTIVYTENFSREKNFYVVIQNALFELHESVIFFSSFFRFVNIHIQNACSIFFAVWIFYRSQ